MTNSPIKWGVLGFARIAQNSLIPAIEASDNSEFYAIASRDESKLEECQSEFPSVSKLYNHYEELLDDPDIQAVYIPLPNSMHKEWSIKAMRKGKHVMCEKPIALNAEECMEMIEASRETGMLLMEAFMFRFTDLATKVKNIVDSGEIGEVKFIDSTFRFLLDRPNTIKVKPELGGGSLYDVGCYPVSFINMITEQLPIACTSQSIIDNGVDIQFSGLMKYESGMIASVHCGFNAFKATHSEIIGTKGRIEIPDTFGGHDGFITVVTNEGSREISVRNTGQYALEVTDFAEAILHNRKPLVTLEESYRHMQVIDMLFATM
ncbi:Gfo/Idh/MocA family protein [Mesobacillus maritimus]|uniref:Gfo/Idh/MocA family protein n=1 Tax=Mesobacillus maritimus TaxID=1643336 RepID=UPI00384FFC68